MMMEKTGNTEGKYEVFEKKGSSEEIISSGVDFDQAVETKAKYPNAEIRPEK